MTMLALAKKVYPNAGWDSAESGKPYCVNYDYFSSNCYSGFDPERNPAQLLDVLCWLTSKTCSDWHQPICQSDGGGSTIFLSCYDAPFVHNNTPQSLAAAIVKAAVRVAGGEDESW